MDPIDTTRGGRSLPVRFTASGSEYFRIWIVNLLLILVTLGLYLPFAKARRLRYFYANTLVDGQPLAFHGDPWRMFRGFLLMVVLFGAYALSGHFNAWAALAMFVLLAAQWPALWRSSLRFRLGNTSWRGLRFGFEGSVAEAYQAMLPWFVPGFVFVLANAWFLDGVDTTDDQAMAAALRAQAPWIGLGFALLLVLLPLGLSWVKRYQHNGYRYAAQASGMTLGTGRYYLLSLKTFALFLIGLALVVFVAFVALQGFSEPSPSRVIGVGMGVSLVYLMVLTGVGAYFGSALQNMTWRATQSQQLRIDSQLAAGDFGLLQFKNLLLTLITLGLYRPFAVVQVMAMRLQAVRIDTLDAVEHWHAGAPAQSHQAAGEMSGDFFGFDIGL